MPNLVTPRVLFSPTFLRRSYLFHASCLDNRFPVRRRSYTSRVIAVFVSNVIAIAAGFFFVAESVWHHSISRPRKHPTRHKDLGDLTLQVQGHPRSSILVSIERALCNFLLVINSNFVRISYRFPDINAFCWKIVCFAHHNVFLYTADKYI